MSQRERPTMAEVARATGYSTSTVSRALRRDPRVTQSTRSHVERVASTLGFTQNALASTLRKGSRAPLIGLLVPHLYDPFFTAIAAGVQSAATASALELIVASHNNSAEEQEGLVRHLVAHRVTGIVVVPAPGPTSALLTREAGFGTPIVTLDRPSGLECDSILTNNADGATRIATKLLADGHKHLGIVSQQLDVWTQRERLAAVEQTLSRAGHALRPGAVVEVEGDGDDTSSALNRMLMSGATAIIGLSVAPLLAALRAARHRGANLAWACFDGHPMFDLLPERILVVRQNPRQMGEAALDLVMSRLADNTTPVRSLVLPVAEPTMSGGINDG